MSNPPGRALWPHLPCSPQLERSPLYEVSIVGSHEQGVQPGPRHCRGQVFCGLSPAGLSHRSPRALAGTQGPEALCPEVLWVIRRVPRAATVQWGGPPPSNHLANTSSRCGLGARTVTESESFLSFLCFQVSCRKRPRRGDSLVEGWTVLWRGGGEHHWPSESGIETDGRGEQYYHSKDPMGAIQQIPY